MAINEKKYKKTLLKEKKELDDCLASGPPEITEYEEYQQKEVLEKHLLGKSRREKRLQAVINVLERIKDGTFGKCLDCGELIDEERLEGDLTRERCPKCEELKHPSLSRKILPHWPMKTKKPAPENLFFR